MLAVLSALLPIAAYLALLRTFDAFTMVRWRSMLMWMVWGICSCAAMMGIVSLARHTGHAWTAPYISPILEETLKVLPLLLLVWRGKVVFLAETQLYGQAIGGGFAFLENILYLSSFSRMTWITALVRGMGTALLHMGCTALCASLLLSVLMRFHSPDRERVPSGWMLCLLPIVLFPSILIHTLYNSLSLPPVPLMVGLIVLFFLLFYLISLLNESNIIRWLDVSLGSDVQLISDLRAGKLQETRAGRYLVQIRDRFEPLVFFDLCVYLQLYLELLVAAKARVMLRDAGLSDQETPEQRELRQSQLAELQALQSRIPRFGLLLLRPLIHATDQDRWALRHE